MASFILAHHFGGTPWQWRQEAGDQDWATGLMLLERMNEANAEGGDDGP